ncbi:MAG TPA: maleylpyruvate isomerase family mycothiol-dependent enzyme [Trebonia sp.]|nr:maleylpyruvate isomerase family mycothiol-dependent enzyme [Trebonia sp.]
MTNATDPTPWVSAVRASHDRLSAIVAGLDADGLRKQSYATEWTIADVLSHLGSGAEIFSLMIEAGVTGAEPPTGEAFQPIWDTWNARTPEEQAAQCAAANEALVARVEALSPAERESFTVVMFGRMTMDLAGVLGMRLSEHAVHTWDIAVALDPAARIAPDAVGLIALRIPTMAGFMGKRQETPTAVAVTTTDPAMTFTLDTGGVTLTPGSTGAAASLALPAEAFVRLVYGRLDDDADVTSADGITVPELRAVFPGF